MIVDDALLTYALETEPSPLVVSPPSGAPSVGNVTIVASAPPRTAVTVTRITIMLPVGNPTAPGASDLTDAAAGLQCSAVFSDGTSWTVASTGAGTFDISPPGGALAIGAGALTITFPAVTVNTVVGTASILVAEFASSGTAPNQPRHAAVNVAKFPYGFFIDNFSGDVGEVAAGGTVTLSWVGSSGATYTITAGAAAPVDVSNVSRWTSLPMLDTTTFVLAVSAQEYGQTVIARFAYTVVVSNPTLPSETVTGTLTAGALSVTGLSTLSALTTTGALNTAASSVTMLSMFQQLTVGNVTGAYFTPTTDGLVIGLIGAQPGAAALGIADYAAETTYVFTASGEGLGNTFTMPVRAGIQFQVGVQNNPQQYAFFFIPFGTGTATALA